MKKAKDHHMIVSLKWMWCILMIRSLECTRTVHNLELVRDPESKNIMDQVILNPDFTYYNTWKYNISNLITIQFYSQYKMYVGRWQTYNLENSKTS